MATNWVKKVGWIYIPTTAVGTVITILTIAFCVTVFVDIDRNSHSVLDTLYGIFPYFISAFTILFWIAGYSSKN